MRADFEVELGAPALDVQPALRAAADVPAREEAGHLAEHARGHAQRAAQSSVLELHREYCRCVSAGAHARACACARPSTCAHELAFVADRDLACRTICGKRVYADGGDGGVYDGEMKDVYSTVL